MTTSAEWTPSLKGYQHFDAPLSVAEIEALVHDAGRVASNKFYPLLLYTESWQPFRDKAGGTPKRKERPIRYASRRDANIYSYYRHLLAAPYELVLADLGLAGSILAYRRLVSADGRGKCNIEFARDAFAGIQRLGDCAAVALDISSFFESLDHDRLRSRWAQLLDVPQLPPDHEAVFRSLTKYAVVDREALCRRLDLRKSTDDRGNLLLVSAATGQPLGKKLCDTSSFREKVEGRGGKFPPLIDVNRKPYGIPQGTPISDLLANAYLLDFDIAMRDFCAVRGGVYYRYSDDVLILVPGGEIEGYEARDYACAEIAEQGARLKIKDAKTCLVVYTKDGNRQTAEAVGGYHGKNGLEYLGFRYDGRHVFIRDATLSRLYRKIASAVRGESLKTFRRYKGLGLAALQARFNYSSFFSRFGRVEDFDPHDHKTWTFLTYAQRSLLAFGPLGAPIRMQLRNFKRVVRRRVGRELAKAFGR